MIEPPQNPCFNTLDQRWTTNGYLSEKMVNLKPSSKTKFMQVFQLQFKLYLFITPYSYYCTKWTTLIQFQDTMKKIV